MSLKDSWKSTGADLGSAFKNLGKTLIRTASTAAQKADEWANGDEEPKIEPKADEPKGDSQQ